MKDIYKAIIFGCAFLSLFIPFLVTESMFFPYITGKNFAFRILVELMLGSWILLALWDVRYRPRFSALLVSGGVLLAVMFFANLLGEYSPKSFWSNFERMDGYVTLVHFYFYFVILGSVIKSDKVWNYFLGTAISVSALIAFKGFSDYLGGGAGSVRIDATLGNSTYMAVYMLFSIFLLALLMLRISSNWKHWLASTPLFLLFVYVLLQTGTRGTFIGLAAGAFVTVSYFAIFARRYPELRKVAVAGLLTLLLVGGGFWLIKDSNFIQNNSALARYANLDLGKDLQVRMTIWGMAWEGVKERPVLGWGQGSFNYVFNKHYRPSLHDQEPWFDRVHNIVLDWLIAGGFLGFLAYISIFISLAYYLFWKPIFTKEDQSFSVPERAVLIGLISGYFVHNLVVFDNLISYIFFAIVLAYVHLKVSRPWDKIQEFSLNEKILSSVFTPIVLVVTVVFIYTINVPAMKSATDIIDSFLTSSVHERFALLDKAYKRDTFANQEIAEQYVQQAIELAKVEEISDEMRSPLFKQAESAMLDMINSKPGDARLHTITGGLYYTYGMLDKAVKQYLIAHGLSPEKPDILLQLGIISYRQSNNSNSLDYFKQAYELAPDSDRARMIYASSLILNGRKEAALDLIGEDFPMFADSQLSLISAINTNDLVLLESILITQVENYPQELSHYSNLVKFYREQNMYNRIYDVLDKMTNNVTSSQDIAECVRSNIKKDRADLFAGC